MKVLTAAALLFLLAAAAVCHAQTVPRLIELLRRPVDQQRLSINYHNCRSWHLAVETGNIISFQTVPSNCEDYVADYLNSDQYIDDSKTVCKEAYFYAKGLALKNDTVNIWIFDVDETLLSNVPFYAANGYGTETIDSESFRKWVKLGTAPGLEETLHLYKNLVYKVGLKPVLITERDEELRESTLQNLKAAGFPYWEKAIFKPTDSNKKIVNFKSSERKKLVRSGHTIIGNIGDQWSDLLKDSPGRRTFKLPNPIYIRSYRDDSKTVCKEAYFFAKGAALKNDTVNVWIFDLDDTLLSTVPYYARHGYGTEVRNWKSFKEWVKLGKAPVLQETLHLYNNLVYKLGIKPVLITERDEELREITLKNLEAAGYTYWEKAIFKPTDSNQKISNFKAAARTLVERSGYTIIGNIGDQWVDLLKERIGRAAFKLPNPMYHLS